MFVSAGGSDSAACTSAAPCRSLARGYAVASSGDVIGVAAGTYPSQTVPGGSKAVTFKGDAGAKLRQLDNGASNVVYDGIEVDGAFATALTFHNSGDNSTFRNGRIGNVIDEKGALVSGSNFTFDNVEFHDVRIETPGVHLECLYAIVVPGLTVKNSEFRNCGVFDIFFTYGFWWSPLPDAYGGVTLHNNFFGRSVNLGAPGYYTVMVGLHGPGAGLPVLRELDRAEGLPHELDGHEQHVRAADRLPRRLPRPPPGHVRLVRQHRRLTPARTNFGLT